MTPAMKEMVQYDKLKLQYTALHGGPDYNSDEFPLHQAGLANHVYTILLFSITA